MPSQIQEKRINGTGPEVSPQRSWQLDRGASSVAFIARGGFGLHKVRGEFEDIDGQLDHQPAVGPAGYLTMKVSSISTGNDKRDEHLRSADFFDGDQHPLVVFSTTSADLSVRGATTIDGVLSARGTEVPIVVRATIEEIGDRLVINGRSSVDRRALEITWGPPGLIRAEVELDVRAVLVEDR